MVPHNKYPRCNWHSAVQKTNTRRHIENREFPIIAVKNELSKTRLRCELLLHQLRVGSIPTLHLKTFEQLFWTTTWRKNSRKAQWQAQSRYLCHCAFFVSFRYAGTEKTWPKHFISICLALATLPWYSIGN